VQGPPACPGVMSMDVASLLGSCPGGMPMDVPYVLSVFGFSIQ
jgi:hypothetical protein